MKTKNVRLSLSVGLVLLFGTILFVSPARAVPGVPDNNINDYVIFAFDSFIFKGGNTAGTGIITGGNVGVNNADPNPSDSSPSLNVGANGAFVMITDGTQLVGDSVRFDSEANVYDIFYNTTVQMFAGTIRHAQYSWTPQIIPTASLPTLGFTPGRASTLAASNVTVASNQTLAPGTYQNVNVNNGVTLNLQAGTYNMLNFHTGQNCIINFQPGTTLLIDGKFDLGDGSVFRNPSDPNNFADVRVGSFGVGSNNVTVNFGQNVDVHGNFYAPNGQLDLGHGANDFGHFWADTITSDFNDNVGVPEPSTYVLCGVGLVLLLGGRLLRKNRLQTGSR